MIAKKLRYFINSVPIDLIVDYEKVLSTSNKVLYVQDKCSLNVGWEPTGYTIQPFLYSNSYSLIKAAVEDFIVTNLKKIKTVDSNFTLEKYHNFVTTSEHYSIIKKIAAGKFGINGIPLNVLPINYKEFDEYISSICNKKYTIKMITLDSKSVQTFHYKDSDMIKDLID